MNSKTIEVAAAVIIDNNKILLAKRLTGYLNDLWEFPGGKIEANETPHAAAIREIDEELGIKIEANKTLLILEHEYPDKRVRLHFLKCNFHSNQKFMNFQDNTNVNWFSPEDFPFGQFCPADAIAAKNIQWNKIIFSEEK